MSLRLICGRSGTGKSNFCFEEIKQKIENNDKQKIYIITPEQFSFTAEQKLLDKLEVGSSLQAEVLTFARMAYRVMQEVGGVVETQLSKAGQAMLIYDILEKEKNNLNFLGKSSQNIDLVQTQLTELKKHAVSLEMLKQNVETVPNRYLQEKLKDIINIYEKHQNKLKGKYIEENDRLEILANQLEQTDIFKGALIYIDEFTGFTKQEYKIIEQLLKTAKQVSITITTDNLDMQTTIENDLFFSNKQTADKLLYIARNNNIECEKTVFLGEAYRFKTKELKHLEKNFEKIPYISYNEKIENLFLFLAKNPYSEVEYVAKQIYRLVKSENYRFKDIAVMTKEIENYGSLCKAIFASYDIPVFLDEKKELSQNEFAKYVLSLLEVFAKNWSYESVIEYIKTGFADLTEDEIYEFENYSKKWGIKGSKWYKSSWNFGEQENEKTKEKAEKMLAIKEQIINPLVDLKQSLTGTKKVGQMNEALYNFLIANHIPEKLQKRQKELEEQEKEELAKEQESVWNIVINLLDEMNELFKDDNITFEKYRELLKVGLSQAPLGKIPQTQDQVMVGTLDRTRTHKVKVVFIIGMNDGIFPTIQKNEGFLNDSDRKILKEKGIELAKGTLENLYEDNLNIYKALTTAEEKIYFSYPSSNLDGGALRPSTYITKLKRLFPKLQEESDLVYVSDSILNENDAFEGLIENLRRKQDGEEISKIWNSVEGYFAQKTEWKDKLENVKKALSFKNEPETITKENIQKLYGNTIVTSISKLEQFESCPFSYYLKYGLKLKPVEEYQIQSIDTGTFMHEVIDTFFSLTRERDLNVKKLEDEQLEELIAEIIDEKLGLAKYYIFTSSDKFQVLTNKLKRVVMQSMKYLIEGLKNSDFEVFANELEFKKGKEYAPITINLDDGKKVEITGKIDRIDLAKTKNGKYIRIIDYKSSVKNIDLNQVVAGLQIQLLTYLDAACKIEEVLPAGILYYNLIDPILKTDRKIDKEQIEDEMKKKFKMNGLILADVNIVKMMDKSLEKGASNVVPAYLDKDGNLSKSKSNIVTAEQFEDLRKYTNRIIKQIAEEMLKGKISIEPYYQKKNQKTPCDYCEYKDICNFKECGSNNYRYIPNDKKEDILEKISH